MEKSAPSARTFLNSYPFTVLVFAGIVFVAGSMPILNGFPDRCSAERMSPPKMLCNPFPRRFPDIIARTFVPGKHPFQCFLDQHYLGLCRDQVGIARHRLPIGRAKFLSCHLPTIAWHLALFDMRVSTNGVDHLDFFCDALDTVPAHVNAIAGLCVTVSGRLFKTHAPHLMLPAILELESNISGSLGIGTIAVGGLPALDQTSRSAFVVVNPIRALPSIGSRTSLDLRRARMGPVPDLSPISERLPVKLGWLIALNL